MSNILDNDNKLASDVQYTGHSVAVQLLRFTIIEHYNNDLQGEIISQLEYQQKIMIGRPPVEKGLKNVCQSTMMIASSEIYHFKR